MNAMMQAGVESAEGESKEPYSADKNIADGDKRDKEPKHCMTMLHLY